MFVVPALAGFDPLVPPAKAGTTNVGLFGEDSPEAIGPAVYTFGCMFTGTLLARYWASRKSDSELEE